MNAKAILMSLLVCAAYAIPAAAADNRFDGIWVGTEGMMGYEFRGQLKSQPYARNIPAKIVIAQGGTLVGVLEGYGPGRYNDVQRVGNTIVFRAGQRVGQLSLAADGQTLSEKGVAPGVLIMNYGARQGALSGSTRTIPTKGTADVTGTFHRSSK